MINYVKKNLDSISKLFINHVGMVIFSLVVFIAAEMIGKGVFYAMAVLAVLMYFSLIYTAMWEKGASDKLKIDGGREKKNIFHGLYFYLLANCIIIFLALVSLCFAFFVTEEPSFANKVYGITTIINHYITGIYLPITRISALSSMPVVKSLVYLATVLPGCTVSFVSYVLGVSGCKCIFPEPKHDKNRRVR